MGWVWADSGEHLSSIVKALGSVPQAQLKQKKQQQKSTSDKTKLNKIKMK